MNKKLLIAFAAPILVCFIATFFQARHYERQLARERTLHKLSGDVIAVGETTLAMHNIGCSNFTFLVMGEYHGEQMAALVESNVVRVLDVKVKTVYEETNTVSKHLPQRL